MREFAAIQTSQHTDLKEKTEGLLTFHLNGKYHPWGLINDMQMSIYDMKHWHALSHSLHFVRHEGDWRPSHPPQRVSRVPDYLFMYSIQSVLHGLVPGQIDSPYLIIMSGIAMPRDEYYTDEVSYPLGETDQYEDQSKDILNSILKEELSDSVSEPVIEEL